ncbi:E3 ubiquitin-protein ligase HUWE1-like [Oopsacas minuta]|uniref:HECT-type E3 ubiquitin transferase n=1 Tax=Oopsacas minuta TaxID=111878 RepID=A0AAV7JT98_9METZ|nr:E3 ubiquitin-protein ligase HUWE1-like [Oopsacas minuta]
MLSALCLNERGLNVFLQAQPFDRLFSILISPEYLSAMRKRKNVESSTTGFDATPAVLGSSMDQLMRHQPTLRSHVFDSLIKLLERILDYGTDPDWIITPSKGDTIEDVISYYSEEPDDSSPTVSENVTLEKLSNQLMEKSRHIPLIDYILNVIRFISHIVANKSYNDDHLNEFQQRGGMSLILKILCMPNLPLDFSNSQALTVILSSIKQIVEFMKNPQDILEFILSQHLSQLLDTLSPLYETSAISLKSVLMSCSQIENQVSTNSLLHRMCITQHYIALLANMHKTNNEAKFLKYLGVWIKDDSTKLILKQLSFLHNSLFWESALLLNEPVTSSSLIPVNCPTKERERLIPDDSTPAVPTNSTEATVEVVVDKKPTSSVIKKLKPCFHVIRHLGSNLTDLFTHLVRFACNTPGIRNKISRNAKVFLHDNCVEMVKVLIEILKDKLLWQPNFQDSKYGRDILHLVKSCLIISSSNFLFDERKQPYLLMLSEFEKAGGFHVLVQIYEQSFNTLTQPCQDANMLTYPIISCDKWLSAWLNFVEKLLNINLVLHSQNIILPFKPTPSEGQNQPVKCYQFEPTSFLINAQQVFIEPLKASWKLLNNLNCSGSLALLEPHLTILCGIIQGENVLRERLEMISKKTPAPAPVPEVFTPNALHVERLTEMGFTSQHAGKALESCNNNIAQALDWIMTHPAEVVMEGLTEDDQVAKAIALSLDGQPKEEPQATSPPELLNLRDDPEFIDDVISCCAHLLKKIPQAVYRIVPLFTVITVNWGPSYIEPSLHLIFKEFYETATLLQESPLNSPIYQHLYSLVLLLIFLFENLTYNTLTCTSGSPIQDHCINLFGLAVQQLQNDSTTIIEWLSPLILFIDLLEKHSQIIIHRQPRPKELFYWSWMNTGRWTNFLPANSKLINKAFSEGASSVTVPLEKNNRYIISFDNMTMRGLEPHAQSIPIRYSKIPDAPKQDSPAPTSSDSEAEVVSKVVPASHGDHMRDLASALALNYDQKVRIITSCATILQFVKNTSLLQAVLQLSIRLTRDYRMALIFGECKGYIHLFSFKKDMIFSGFQALTSILIRHLFESENALRYMMESAIRIAHHCPSPNMSGMPYRMGRRSRNTKDLDALFRSIGPIYNKHPEVFMEIAKEVFRLDDSPHQQLFTQEPRKLEIVKLLPRKKPFTTLDNENQEAFIRDLLELLYHGNDPADSSTATNPLLLGNSLPFDPLFPTSSNMIRLARNRFNPFDRLHGNFLRGDPLRSFQLQVNNMMDMVDEDMDIDELSDMQPLSFQMPSPLSTAKVNPSEQAIVSKSGILRLLAELVTSYPMCANFICQEKLPRNGETTALTYILDNLIHESKVAKSFLRTIGGLVTSNFPDVQILLVTELKQAILRVSQLPECQLKHIKLRALLGLINTFLVVPGKGYTLNIAKSMVKRNFASDLAKVFHSLDLNSPDLPETANNIIRTIEALTKLLYNTPGHQNQVKKVNKTTTDTSRGDQTAGVEANADAQPTTSNGDQASNSDPIELADTANASGDATLIEHSMEDPSYNEMMMIELSNIIKADDQENEDIYLSATGGDDAGTDSDSTSSDRTGDTETDESMDGTEELREDPDNCNSAGEELDNYDCLDEPVVGEHLDSNDVRVVISLGASQNIGAGDLQHSSIEDDDTSIDLNVTSPHDITEDPDNTVADDLDNDDDQPPSDVLLGSSSSNDEHEIPDDVEIESDVSQDSDAETEEMSEVVTIMGQSYDYDSSADLEDLDLQDDLFPILRREYSINRNLFRESMFPGMQRPHNTNRIPAHPLLNRQTNRPHQPSPHQPPPTQQSSLSLRVSDPQSVLQLVSSIRSAALPEPGARPLPGQWRRLVLEQDQLVFEEDPLLHKEHNIESQDNEDEGFIPMCNLRIHQEDGILGSCYSFQSIKKAQEEIAVFLREENEKEKNKKQETKDSTKLSKEELMKDILDKFEKDPLTLPTTISPPPLPLPLPEALLLSNISIPSPSEQLPASNLLEPSADQPSLPTQFPTDSPLLFNQFDGSQLSARQTLQQIDSNHPLYTFFSAVAGHPPPPNPLIPNSSSTTVSATSLPADTSTVQLTAPPTVTTIDRPREGPAGDTSHVPPDTNLPLSQPLSIPMHNVSDTAATPEQSAANIFTPITPIYPYQELPGSTPPVTSEAPTTSEEPVSDTNSQTGQENVVPPPPAPSGPTLLPSIDPDFLAAIPETLRVEIIREEQELRTVLRDRTPTAPNAPGRQRHELDHVHGEISTEVLAEMPADIQDEIISQRRIEQQRQNLVTSDDPCSFLNTLPSALRQTVLNEMDEETFGNLPSDVQEEATHRHRPRQRDYAQMFESRQMLADPLQQYDLLSIPSPSFYLRRFEAHNIIPPYAMRRRGMLDFSPLASDPTNKPPLDFEALTCLLSVLFLDTSKIQRQKYNQLIRLLCGHKETRNWILSILTYFLADINKITIPDCSIQTAPPIVIQINQSNTGQYTIKEEPMLEDQHKTLDCISITPQPKKKSTSWMSITQTCGSGLQNILQLETPSGKGSKPAQLHLHTQAQNTLNNNILDAFLQLFVQTSLMSIGNQKGRETPSMMSKYFLEPTTSALLMHSKFWECLIKLESSHVNSKGKASNRSHMMLPNLEENSNGPPLVHVIINLLECEHIRSNQPLLDKFIKLLWNICQNLKPPSPTKLPSIPAPADLPSEVTNVVVPNLDNQPQIPPIGSATIAQLVVPYQSADTNTKKEEVTAKKQEMLFSDEEVNLVIGLLSCKSCDDQSLNNVNQLVMKLAKYHRSIMKHIYSTLVTKCKEVGLYLQTELQALKDELVSYNAANPISSEEAKQKANKNPISFYTLDQQKISKAYRPDLHLPSMSPFLSKASNVSLFLRMLKILQMLKKEIQMLALGEDSPFFDWDNGFDMPPQHSEFRDRLRRDMRTHVQELTERSDQVTEQIQGYMQVLNEDPDSFDENALSLRTEAIRHVMLRRQEERGVPSSSRGKRDPADQIRSTPLIKNKDSYRLSQVLSLPSLWALLEDCLEALAMSCHDHAVLVMQNMVECFFIVHAGDRDDRLVEEPDDTDMVLSRYDREGSLASLSDLPTESSQTPASPSRSVSSLSLKDDLDMAKFLQFADCHRVVLNQILRQTTTPLSSGTFSILIDHTRLLDFDVKREYFRQELEATSSHSRREDMIMQINRKTVFEDSFRQLSRKSPEEMKNKLYVIFKDEDGQDAGGLLREWYLIVSREIFNPDYALFTTTPGDKVTYVPNSCSYVNHEHLDYFKFVGRLIAKAIYDNKLLDCYFGRSFYKHILSKPVQYTDLESEDYGFYKSMLFLMEHNLNEIGCEFTFSTEVSYLSLILLINCLTYINSLIPLFHMLIFNIYYSIIISYNQMGFLECIFSPNLYFIYKSSGFVTYSPNFMESIPNVILKAGYFVINIAWYLSPIILYNYYKHSENFFTLSTLQTSAKLFTLSAVLLSPLYLTRGLGRYMSPEYQEFLRTLERDSEEPHTSNYQSLKKYDFDIHKIPPAFYQSKSRVIPITPLPPLAQKYSTIIRYSFLYGFILDLWHYLIAHSVGRAAIYPGSLSIVNSIVGIDCAIGRHKLLVQHHGLRAKLKCNSGHTVDTIYVKLNESMYSDTLVICCEGNAAFMESASTHHFIGRGYSILGWNHPGFQHSTGMPYPAMDQEAVVSVIQYAIEELHYPIESIMLYGWSIGGYSAAYAAACFPKLKGIILDASFDDIVPLAECKMPDLLKFSTVEVLNNYFNLKPHVYLSQYPGPVTLIRRTKDDIITTDVNNRAVTNRGNDLLMCLLKTRYPFLFNQKECYDEVLRWLHVSDGERINLESRVNRSRMVSLINEFSETDSLAVPCNIGGALSPQDQRTLAMFLAMQYMKHFTSTHNTPVLINLLDPPKPIDEFGKMEIKDLVKNGRDLPVTEENKKDYVRLVCQMKMTGAIHKQIKSFLEGFYEIIPKKLISIFNEQELELLISGLPNIDIDDLKANTEYYKYNETSIQIQWFWRALRSFEQADRAKFLQFVTGTSKVPLRGFAYLEGMNGSQKFQIHKDERSDMRLPSAHTCFNQLDLPAYSCYEDLRSNLLYASQECPEGFGLA